VAWHGQLPFVVHLVRSITDRDTVGGRESTRSMAYHDGVYDGFKYSAGYKVVTPGYLETLGMRLREGRFLSESDTAGQPPAAVVSETFVKRFLPRVDPIGVRFKYAGMDMENPLFTIVGVVGDVRQQSLLRAPVPQVFVSMYQQPWRAQQTVGVAARAADARQQLQIAAAIRDTLRQFDPDVPVEISSLERMVSESVADRRFLLMLVGSFAALALLLAATGIYSVLSQAVAQRTSEIGIRMALGADASSVVGLMLQSAMRSVGVGAVAGLVAPAAKSVGGRGSSAVWLLPVGPDHEGRGTAGENAEAQP